MLILGEKEVEENTVSVRSRDTGESIGLSLDDFMEQITAEIRDKK